MENPCGQHELGFESRSVMRKAMTPPGGPESSVGERVGPVRQRVQRGREKGMCVCLMG